MIRKHRASERGMSAIPFVVALLLLIIAVFMWYKADQEATELRAKATTNASSAKQWEERWQAESNARLELTETTGYGDQQNKTDKAALQAALNGALEKWRTLFVIEFTADKFTPTGNGGQVERLQGDKIKVVYVPAKDQIANPSIQTLLPILEAASARMQNDIKRAFEEKAAEVKAKVELTAARDKVLGEKDTAYAGLRAEYDQSKRAYEQQISELREKVSTTEQALQAAQSEAEAVKAEKEKAVATLTAQLNQKVAEIKTLVGREQPFVSEGPDGEVVAAKNGIAIISRGKRDMLMPGTTFKVLGRIKGGELVEKGTLKVITCNDESADCTVVAEQMNNPITGGDLIQSATYSPARKMRFVVIGELRKMGRSAAEGRLRALGAIVDNAVTTETHYLVMGTAGAGESLEETDAYRKAKEFGVQILTEDQLASFTMY